MGGRVKGSVGGRVDSSVDKRASSRVGLWRGVMWEVG